MCTAASRLPVSRRGKNFAFNSFSTLALMTPSGAGVVGEGVIASVSVSVCHENS